MPKKRKIKRGTRDFAAPKGKVSLPATPWDHGPAIQRKTRVHVVQGRGDTNPETGKVVNPNNVTGVRYLRTIDALISKGALPEHAKPAAEDYARLARAVRGSPSQRSCLDFSPVGHDGDLDDPQAVRDWRDWRAIQRSMGMLADAELSRVLWEADGDCEVRDLSALKHGLHVVAVFYGWA